ELIVAVRVQRTGVVELGVERRALAAVLHGAVTAERAVGAAVRRRPGRVRIAGLAELGLDHAVAAERRVEQRRTARGATVGAGDQQIVGAGLGARRQQAAGVVALIVEQVLDLLAGRRRGAERRQQRRRAGGQQ